jgi:uncharacterized membrane protein
MSESTWLIKRNCSASPGQLALVFGSLVAVSFAFGAGFAAHGLWMVLPFVGLELVAVATAFICYGRRAGDFERIELIDGGLVVEQVEGGRRTGWVLDPRKVRVEVEKSGPEAGSGVRVHLRSRAERIEVGCHLLEARRAGLARELSQALRSVPGGAA